MKKILLLSAMFLVSIAFYAQGTASIVFSENLHDFGTIAEENGNVTYDFKFTNNGDAPLVVSRVTASCGCTTPDWSKEPIAPGKTGFIKVTYGAKGRPGQFAKTITVFSNAKDGNVILTIKGTVTPKTASIEESYPVGISDLRLKTNQLTLRGVTTNSKVTDQIEIYNGAKAPLSVKIGRTPAHISVVVTPAVLEPKSKGIITFKYDGAAAKDWGLRSDDVYLLLDDQKQIASDRKIVVTANITEDFSNLSPEKRNNGPHIETLTMAVDLGKVKSDEKKVVSIPVRNTGKSPLIIRKLKTTNGIIEVKLDKMTIPAGKSAVLTVTLLPSKLRRPVNENVFIFSNDPNNSALQLKVYGLF